MPARQSNATMAMRITLTCPKDSVLRTGSRNSAAGSSQPAAAGLRDSRRRDSRRKNSRRKNSRSTAAASAMVTSVSTVPATVTGTRASGASSTAAIGG